MSDLPQRAGPDLHAIFGIDGEPPPGRDPVISIDRDDAADPDGGTDLSAAVEGHAHSERSEIDDVELADTEPEVEVQFAGEPDPPVGSERALRAVELDERIPAEGELDSPADRPEVADLDDSPAAGESAVTPDELKGITRPSRRGSAPRFLTDVIVEMGLPSRGQVEDALESSRLKGTTPERVLLENG